MVYSAEHPHGYFADPDTGLPIFSPAVRAEWCLVGRDMILIDPVVYVDPLGRIHRVPSGERINGLSVPRLLWRICWPFEPLSRDASVVHDHLCAVGHDWVDAAWIFYEAMRCRGVGPVKAWVRWFAVRWIGCWFCKWHRGKL